LDSYWWLEILYAQIKKLKTKHQNSLGVGKPTGLHMIAINAKAMLSMHEGD
jgi:hypothetical protein